MVQEYRKIMLTSDEVVAAFDCYRRVTPDFLPEGRIVHCETSPDGSVTVSVEPPPHQSAPHAKFTFKGLDILRPLIRFCLENNIMLPRMGRKSFSIIEGSKTLSIALNIHIDPTAPDTPMLASHLSNLNEITVEVSATNRPSA